MFKNKVSVIKLTRNYANDLIQQYMFDTCKVRVLKSASQKSPLTDLPLHGSGLHCCGLSSGSPSHFPTSPTHLR